MSDTLSQTAADAPSTDAADVPLNDDAGVLSTEEIRSHFPALGREHEGHAVAYFDGPGGTQVPRAVVEAVSDYLYHHNANTHWAYPTSAETDELIERSRRCVADFLGASSAEIVFGANATTLAYHVSRTLGRTLSAGDEVVVTELDHHANVAPWQALERERRIVLRVVRMNTETGALFCRRELLESLPFPKLAPAPDYAPEVAETGTQNHEGITGAAAAVDFIASLAEGPTRRERLRAAFDALHARGAELTKRMWQGLSEIEGVTLYGPRPEEPRTPTVSFTVRGVASTDVARRLASRGLFLSHGDFYAATVVEHLGLGPEGLVRAGCACYTTRGEVERLVESVREIPLVAT